MESNSFPECLDWKMNKKNKCLSWRQKQLSALLQKEGAPQYFLMDAASLYTEQIDSYRKLDTETTDYLVNFQNKTPCADE